MLSLEHETDFVPYLDPFDGVTILAEAFGCPVYTPTDGDPAVKAPIVFAPEHVYKLERPGMSHPVFERVLDTLAYWQEKTGGVIPLGTTDPQSPLDVVASLIWDSRDFLPSLHTNSKEIHYLLDMITGGFIDFYSKQRARGSPLPSAERFAGREKSELRRHPGPD